MTVQNQLQSHRSLSVFSLNHFRSLSRTGARPTKDPCPNASLRSPSSLSCNPYCQIAISSEPFDSVFNNATEGLINFPVTQDPSEACSAGNSVWTSHLKEDEEESARPRSWFSLTRLSLRKRPARTLSVHFPQDRKSSIIARDVISAPVLIGTTNADIARAECVCCGDLIDTELQTGDYPRKGQSSVCTLKEVDLKDSQQKKMRSSRLSNVRKGSKRKTRTFMSSLIAQGTPENVNEDTWTSPTMEKGIGRRGTETINLCRRKINKLAGNGHNKRKSPDVLCETISRTGNDIGNNKSSNDIITLPQASNVGTDIERFLTLKHSNLDLAVGSLTRSFASAVDKLDLHTPFATPNMGLIKSKSSLFSLKKRNKLETDANLGKTDPKHQAAVSIKPSGGLKTDNGERLDTKLTVFEALKHIQPPGQSHRSNVTGSPAEPLQFSGTANGYISAEHVAGYPKGVKVLGMHSNTMEFATAPSWVTDLPKPPTHTPTIEEVMPVDDEEDVIQDAPIYSPSLGDLSQYARPTPTSVKTGIEVEQRHVPGTPSQTQAEKSHRRRLGLRRSQSSLSLLAMFKRGNKEQNRGDVPLQARDNNKKMQDMQYLKKSRSMNLAGLLRRSETASMTEPLLRDAFNTPSQPVKPSPLRHEAQFDQLTAAKSLGNFQAQRRTPPRGSITTAERAKRMGVVGMPRGSFEGHIRCDNE